MTERKKKKIQQKKMPKDYSVCLTQLNFGIIKYAAIHCFFFLFR